MVREEFERPSGSQWVAEANNEGTDTIVGFAFGWLVVGELHVLHIGTCPDQRRSGVGRKLLRTLVATPGAEVCWLEVRADNVAAIGLYVAEGFTEIARRKRYYADGSDAVVMRR
jgi:ribosomal-protein-alanine N-acetyltransferase